MTVFECAGINKKYKNFTLEDISFRLESGYLTALIGPNGSGKTTLFHCISGAARNFTGDASIDGISLRSEPEKYKEKIGFVSETLSFYLESSILENGHLLGTFFSDWSMEDFYTYLDKMELPPSKPLYQLSKGEMMKMQFCFALAHRPRFLLLDEPMAGFDPVRRLTRIPPFGGGHPSSPPPKGPHFYFHNTSGKIKIPSTSYSHRFY